MISQQFRRYDTTGAHPALKFPNFDTTDEEARRDRTNPFAVRRLPFVVRRPNQIKSNQFEFMKRTAAKRRPP